MSYSAAPTVQDIAHLPCASLPDLVHVPPLTRPFNVTITPPGSKSLTNRALLLAALADGESTLTNALIDADDTRVMIAALRQLGAEIRVADPGEAPGADGAPGAKPGGSGRPAAPTLHIRGTSGRWQVPPAGVTLNLENAGTAVRFLTAAAILAAPDGGGGPITIDGDARMRQRPIAELLSALRSLGATIEHFGHDGFLPIRIRPPTAFAPNPTIEFGRTASSQFISALLLVAPFLPSGLTVRVTQPPTSPSYLYMTRALMTRVGIHFESRPPRSKSPARDRDVHMIATAPHQSLASFTLDIESDASSASYFLAAAALTPGSAVLINGLPGLIDESLQGDVQFQGVLHAMGLNPLADSTSIQLDGPATAASAPNQPLRPFDWDFTDIPDTAMTAAVLACFASPTSTNPTATSTLRGLKTLRHKESDRLTALQTELTKLGATVEIETTPTDEALRITPPPNLPTPSSLRGSVASSLPPLTFDTYNDHRMAMSLALIGLRRPNVFIKNPACVAKTYPTFWRDLARLYSKGYES